MTRVWNTAPVDRAGIASVSPCSDSSWKSRPRVACDALSTTMPISSGMEAARDSLTFTGTLPALASTTAMSFMPKETVGNAPSSSTLTMPSESSPLATKPPFTESMRTHRFSVGSQIESTSVFTATFSLVSPGRKTSRPEPLT